MTPDLFGKNTANYTAGNAPDTLVFFVDMNSFFATCEQQVNYYLRGRPVAVCVYTGKYGCVIAPSIEAKQQGVKVGMRLNEATKICPHLVPLETHPARYREFHIKIMDVLRKYCDDVISKSIDEAVMNLTSYRYLYKDPEALALKIKHDIREQVGDYLKCSIGIAPNAFLAKLASDLQKPDGLVKIMPDNIDEVLKGLQLTDLPGISKGMAARLENGGVYTPLQLRYASPWHLKAVCKSIVGLYWHQRLNFAETDLHTAGYKSMQAMRQVSREQRQNIHTLEDILLTLCMTLEKRMVKNQVYARMIFANIRYANGYSWNDKIVRSCPVQDGTEIITLIKLRMKKFQQLHRCENLINENIVSMSVGVSDFIPAELLQYELFADNVRQHNLRKSVYEIKGKYGPDKIMKAIELRESEVLKDVIGFGSVRDLPNENRLPS
jgi:DNA polymerase-4